MDDKVHALIAKPCPACVFATSSVLRWRPCITVKSYPSKFGAAAVSYLPEVAARRLGLVVGLAITRRPRAWDSAVPRTAALWNCGSNFEPAASQTKISQDAPAASEPLAAKKHAETPLMR